MSPFPVAASEEPQGLLDVKESIDVLAFRIGRTSLGVCIDEISEIAEVEEFVRLTASDASLRGVIVSRGRAIPMIDVARRLGLSAPARYAAPVLLVTIIEGDEIGFLVDDPEDVLTMSHSSFRPLPELIQRTLRLPAPYALAVHETRLLLLIDLHLLMTTQEAHESCLTAKHALSEGGAS